MNSSLKSEEREDMEDVSIDNKLISEGGITDADVEKLQDAGILTCNDLLRFGRLPLNSDAERKMDKDAQIETLKKSLEMLAEKMECSERQVETLKKQATDKENMYIEKLEEQHNDIQKLQKELVDKGEVEKERDNAERIIEEMKSDLEVMKKRIKRTVKRIKKNTVQLKHKITKLKNEKRKLKGIIMIILVIVTAIVSCVELAHN